MLAIDPTTVTLPIQSDPKTFIENPFETDNLADKSPNGIADNHPKWITTPTIGKQILDIYTKRVLKNLKGII
jgi:hypothetical protein